MITRNEAKEKVLITKREFFPYGIDDNVDEIIDELFDQQELLQAIIEAQEIIIKDMAQPKTCDGCVFEATKQNHSNWCSGCIREKMYLYDDRYEPKAQP